MYARLLGLALLLGIPDPARAVEDRLQVANPYADSFVHYFDGPIGPASGELVMDRPGGALDTDKIPDEARLSGDCYLSRSIALGQGIAAVVGENSNPSFADRVYIMVEHPPRPTTFKAVVGWDRRRSADHSNLEGGPTLRN